MAKDKHKKTNRGRTASLWGGYWGGVQQCAGCGQGCGELTQANCSSCHYAAGAGSSDTSGAAAGAAGSTAGGA